MMALLVGLILQFGAALLVILDRRGRIRIRAGGVAVIVMFAYHGLGETLARLSDGTDNVYRLMVDERYLQEWLLGISISVLAFGMSYRGFSRYIGDRWGDGADQRRDKVAHFKEFEFGKHAWVGVAVASLALYLLLLTNRADTEAGHDLVGGLARQFLLLLSSLAVVLYGVHRSRRRLALALAVQVAALILLGQRFMLIAAAVSVLVVVSVIRPHWASRRGWRLTGVVLIGLAFIALSTVRASEGRFDRGDELQARYRALASGITLEHASEAAAVISGEAAYRLDGNSFGALVHQETDRESEDRPGLSTLLRPMRLAVPGVVNRAKLESAVSARHEEAYVVEELDLPPFDYLPTPAGIAAAIGGLPAILASMALFGVALAWVDARFLRPGLVRTIPRIVLALGAIHAVLVYEQGLEGIVLTVRGVAALSFICLSWITMRKQLTRGRLR